MGSVVGMGEPMHGISVVPVRWVEVNTGEQMMLVNLEHCAFIEPNWMTATTGMRVRLADGEYERLARLARPLCGAPMQGDGEWHETTLG